MEKREDAQRIEKERKREKRMRQKGVEKTFCKSQV